MNKIIFLIFFGLIIISSKVVAQEQYVYVYDSITKQDYRIRFYKTNVTVITREPQRIKFKDQIAELDSGGLYFKKAGFYAYKNIDTIQFKPYRTSRKIFQPVYYITVFNVAVFSTLLLLHRNYTGDRGAAIAIMASSPLWAFLIPQFQLIRTHKVVLLPQNVAFNSGPEPSITHEK
ncbi:MAG: hypothetical protein Q8M15_05215 [Bacteroidota bacterium]|nr:hypothetical protein [Bacteroidota bacterium]